MIMFEREKSILLALIINLQVINALASLKVIQSYDEERLASVHINQAVIAHSATQQDFEHFCQRLTLDSELLPVTLSLRANQTTNSDFSNFGELNDPFVTASPSAYSLSQKSEKALYIFKSYVGKEEALKTLTNGRMENHPQKYHHHQEEIHKKHNKHVEAKAIPDQENHEFKSLNTLFDNLKIPAPFCAKAEIEYCHHHARYRTNNGACNNLYNNWWGMAESPYKRLLPAEYDDGINKPREKSSSSAGKHLPNARSLAISLYNPRPVKTDFTNLLAYFSQFIEFDVSLTPRVTSKDGELVKCNCKSTKQPSCFNIQIPKSDKHNKDQTCMSVVRSLPSSRDFDCNVGPREQMNAQTHWLDLSNVYGIKNDLAFKLRAHHNGMLKTTIQNGNSLLPFLHSPHSFECSYRQDQSKIHAGSPDLSRSKKCFLSGDPRTEFDAIQTSLHTIWIREHNRIAYHLSHVNPHWDDERLYQESRRLVIAIYQNIIYSEYLPSLLGADVLELYDLKTHESGYFLNYKPYLYPQVSNEFHTAAIRFYFNMLSDHVNIYNMDLSEKKSFNISKTIYNNEMYIKYLDSLLRGSLIDPALEPRSQINYYFLNHLFKGLFQSDSIKYSEPALNIQRGRDHGIPGYNKYRQLCGLSKANKFDDFDMAVAIKKRLKQLYESPDDVDLYVGLLSEYPAQGSLLGPTASCIIAKTFRDLKFADRFYFETNNADLRFSEEQLNSIRRVKLSKVLCQNSNIERIQPLAFSRPNTNENKLGECKELEDVDFSLWKARPEHHHYLKADLNNHRQSYHNNQPYPYSPDNMLTPLAYTTAIFHEYRPKALGHNPFVNSRIDLEPAYENIYRKIKPVVHELYPDLGHRVNLEPTFKPRFDHKWTIEDFYPLLEKNFKRDPRHDPYKPRDIHDFYPSFHRPVPEQRNHHNHHHKEEHGKYWLTGGPYEARYDDKYRSTTYGRDVDSLMVGNNKRSKDGKSAFRRGIESLLDGLMVEKMKSDANVKFIDRRDMYEANRRQQGQYGYGSLLSGQKPAEPDLFSDIKHLMTDLSQESKPEPREELVLSSLKEENVINQDPWTFISVSR